MGKGMSTRVSAVPSNALSLGTLRAFVGGIAATTTNTYKVAKGQMAASAFIGAHPYQEGNALVSYTYQIDLSTKLNIGQVKLRNIGQ